jgi:eukaryotic-like serine/threonine-protein kinase
MPLSAGEKFGQYEVLSLLGQGGMGEVYRARDTTLKRDVALKVLPATFLRDHDRMARFQREAEVLASLDHPNIGHIHGIVDSEDSRGLVLALVEGPTLADHIEAGPMPPAEAIHVAKQIIDALEYAHDRGVVHRDLKPANVKITPDGAVKVLDFGLAKVLEDEPPPSSLANSPTLTVGHTRAGMILGTAAYMSPEQAVGRIVDRRSDIFSFGAVLYEMLTGERAFAGATTPDVLEAVVKNDPDWSQLPAGTPRYLRRLLERTLTKDRKQRLQAIGEARIILEKGEDAIEAARPGEPRVGSKLPWITATIAGAAALALGYVAYRHNTEEPPPLQKLSILPPNKGSVSGLAIPAISPDGHRLAFGAAVNGKTSLWVRELDALTARQLPGTEDGLYPFWSPDSRTVAFFTAAKLKKIDVAGGPAITLCDASAARGGTWAGDVIVFGLGGVGMLLQVPAAGGAPTPILRPDSAAGETLLRWPWFLPDGRHFLYSVNSTDQEKVGIFVADLATKQHQRVIGAASNAAYVPTLGAKQGHLLFARDRTLMALPFDAGKLQPTGDAVPIAEDIDRGANSLQNQFSASQNGVLVYKSGGSSGGLQLTWFDRSGKSLGVVSPPSNMPSRGAISPDGFTVAWDRIDAQTSVPDVWLYDLKRGTNSRFTFGPSGNFDPVWSSDGTHIAFSSTREGMPQVFQRGTRGVETDQLLTPALGDPPHPTHASAWSPDGRYFIVEVTGGPNGTDIWVQPLFGDRKPFPYLNTSFNEIQARFSPDGKWVAYSSDETRRFEVYVQTFPSPGGKSQISTEGGSKTAWSRDGKELYFIGADRKMMAANIKTGQKIEAGTPKALFDTRIGGGSGNLFDVSKDGRFLIPWVPEDVTDLPLTVVLNWPAMLKK